jgi:lipoprotein NlpI
LPEPLLKELEEVKDDVNKVRDLIARNDFNSALKIAEEGFKEKYEKGDIQVPEAEEVVSEALALSASVVKLGAKLDYAKAMATIDYYYRVLVSKNSLEEIPKIFMTVLSSFSPP